MSSLWSDFFDRHLNKLMSFKVTFYERLVCEYNRFDSSVCSFGIISSPIYRDGEFAVQLCDAERLKCVSAGDFIIVKNGATTKCA